MNLAAAAFSLFLQSPFLLFLSMETVKYVKYVK